MTFLRPSWILGLTQGALSGGGPALVSVSATWCRCLAVVAVHGRQLSRSPGRIL
jgi:hypothetical protein